MKEKIRQLLTKRDVSRWLRIKPERIDWLIREHGFPVIRIPSEKRVTLRFDRDSVAAWKKEREQSLPY